MTRAMHDEPAAKVLWDDFIESRYARARALPAPAAARGSDRAAVMIEPRCHPHMEFALRLAMHFLGPEWGLELFVGPANRSFVEEMVDGWGSVRLHDTEKADLSAIEYSTLKKEPTLWRAIGAEHVLWLEPDCIVCRPGIDSFLGFDYVGAPWHPSMALAPSCRVGNGGLSLRRRAAMLSIAEQANRHPGVFACEDVFFVANMHLCNRRYPGSYKVADVDTAAAFSVESLFHPQPFGLHKTWAYLGADRLSALLDTVRL